MAPRRKRNTKAKNAKAKVNEKVPLQQETASIPETPSEKPASESNSETDPPRSQRISPRQHKKFGKFRFLIEESQKADDLDASSNSECIKKVAVQSEPSSKASNTKITEDGEDLSTDETKDLVLTNSEGSVPVNQTEIQEDGVELLHEEFELSQQLKNLEVGSVIIEDCSEMIVGDVEVTECDATMYIDNVESDILIESVSEQQDLDINDQIENQESDVKDEQVQNLNETESEDVEKDERDTSSVILETIESVVQNKNKKSKPKNRKPPKTAKKTKPETQNSNSDGSSASESSIRRSSRIKSISVLKQRSKGYGLVKSKSDNHVSKSLDSDTSENSNSGLVDSEKVPASLESPGTSVPSSEGENKPVKVKSRWRRSSELEMSNSSPSVSSRNSPQTVGDLPQISHPAASGNEKGKIVEQDEEVTNRLKQFVHLKENNYLTERISCKEAKKMTCDCFLTPEEIGRGEYGCGEDCLNRLLMIEW